MGQIFLKTKKLDEALDQFREIQKFDSEDLDIRTKMGLIYMEQGKLDQAILEFNFVLAARPDDDRVTVLPRGSLCREGIPGSGHRGVQEDSA